MTVFALARPHRVAMTGTAAASADVLASSTLTWKPAPGEVATLTVANGRLSNSFISQCNAYYSAFNFARCRNDYSGGDVAPSFGSHGAMIYWGGGHASSNNNSAVALVVGEVCSFRRLNDASPIFGTGTDSTTQASNSGATGGPGDFGGGSAYIDPATCRYTVDDQPGAPHSYSLGVMLPPYTGASCGAYFTPAMGSTGLNNAIDTACVTSFRMPLPSSTGAAGSYAWEMVTVHPTYPNAYSDGAAFGNILPAPTWSWHDVDGDRVFYQNRSGYYAQPRWFDLSTETYVQGTGTGGDFSDTTAGDTGMHVWIPSRRLVVWLYRSSSTSKLAAKWMDCSVSQPSWVNTGATFNTALDIPDGWSIAAWCSANSRIILGGIGTTLNASTGTTTSSVWELQVPATLTDQWTVTERALGSGQTIRWWPNNTYKAWSYNESAGMFIFFPHADSSGAGSGTIDATGVDTVYAYTPYV